MLKKKAIEKILITTFTIFIIFVFYLIPEKINDKYLDVEQEIEYVSSTSTNEIYLLGPNNYLVKVNVLIEEEKPMDKIKKVIEYLTINKKETLPTGLKGIIPENTKLNKVNIEKEIATLDFNEELLNVNEQLEERLIEAITFGILNVEGIKGVKITINNTIITTLPKTKKEIPEILTRDFGINKRYDINNRNSIQKVVIFYLDKISNNNYYVPVTKYINDDRDKIEIIIENLASKYIFESNLKSMLNQNTELINYEIDDEIMVLNFNDAIFNQEKILEEVTYTLSYSVFANYDVKEIMIEVDGKEITKIK